MDARARMMLDVARKQIEQAAAYAEAGDDRRARWHAAGSRVALGRALARMSASTTLRQPARRDDLAVRFQPPAA